MKHPVLVPVESSSLKGIAHNAQGLFVGFKNGSVYVYPECPRAVFLEGLQHKSPGTWHRESVKDRFKAVKL